MRVLFVYKHNSQDPTQKSLMNTLPGYINDFHLFCFASNERKRFDPENLLVSDRFIATVNAIRPTHIFMWLVYLNVEEIAWCKKRGIIMVAAINGFASFSTGLFKSRDLYIESLQQLDIYFIPHQPHISRMKELGINAVELPFSFDPKIFKKLPVHIELNKFFFVGNFGDDSCQSQYRIEMLSKVADAGKLFTVSDIRIAHRNIRGSRPIPYESIINFLANCSKFLICSDYFPNLNEYDSLNDSETTDYTVEYLYAIRPRIYTMVGSGSAVIIERHDQLQRFFTDEKHLIMWTDYEELKDKVNYYDRNKKAYRQISHDGYEYVRKYHTINNRIKDFILPALNNRL